MRTGGGGACGIAGEEAQGARRGGGDEDVLPAMPLNIRLRNLRALMKNRSCVIYQKRTARLVRALPGQRIVILVL